MPVLTFKIILFKRVLFKRALFKRKLSNKTFSKEALPRKQKVSGFSLIEVLVAMTVMAVIGVSALSLFNTAGSATGKIKHEGKRLNNLQRAFMFISNDIQQIANRSVRDEFGDIKPSLSSDLQSSIPNFSLVRLGRRNPAELPRSNLEQVVYSLEDKILYRTSFMHADGMSDTAGLKRKLLEKIESMEISFLDGEEWRDEWPSLVTNQSNTNLPNNLANNASPSSSMLPIAIKLTLEFSDYGKIERLYSISEQTSGTN